MVDAKRLVFDGFRRAVADGVPREEAGILIDEELGADIARAARTEGHLFAMPVEKSGQREFDFEYGSDFGAHLEAFDPSFAKVLVRYNPEGDPAVNARQSDRLRELTEWLHRHDRRFMFELLVEPEPHQLERVGGDLSVFDRELRPGLMATAIAGLQDAGVEPDVWKIEGVDRRDDCVRLARVARRDGRDQVACVVLGRGADVQAVVHWLRQGAGVPGYIGFAVGRTIWWDPLSSFLEGRADREQAVAEISANYRRLIEVYTTAS